MSDAVLILSVEILLIAFALSVDAFAVSMAASAAGRLKGVRSAGRLAFHFGLFQFIMPVIGWGAGAALERWIAPVDHWLAFALLVIVGARMFRAGLKPEVLVPDRDVSRGMSLVALSLAVSVDALAVGLSLGMLNVPVWITATVIGVVASAMSLLGVLLGSGLHTRLGRLAELFGGTVLVLIAVRIVVSHLSAS